MVALSIFVGLCTYLMHGTKLQYFGQVAGFVTVIICLDDGVNSTNAFETALLRAEQTGLGILVYSLVTLLLWSSSTRDELDAAVRRLAATQHDLYRRYRKLLGGQGTEEETHPLRMQEMQQFNQFSQALAAARTDSYEVWEVRRQWLRVQSRSKEVMETLEHVRESLKEARDLDLEGLLPNLEALAEELDGRFEQVGRMLEDKPPERTPRVLDLPLNKGAERALTHFQKAALAVTRNRLQHLEALTRSLFETLADIKGFGSPTAQAGDAPARQPRFLPDPDRIAAAVGVMASLWLAYLVWIYTGGEVPGGIGFVDMTGAIGMALSTPQASGSLLYLPVAVGTASVGGEDIDLVGSLAVTIEDHQLITVDLSLPASPALLAQLELPQCCGRMTLAEGRAYVSAGEGIAVVDLGDPTTPQLLFLLPVDTGPVYDLAATMGWLVL